MFSKLTNIVRFQIYIVMFRFTNMDLYYIYYSCVASGTTCTAAGWGLISERGVASEELKEVKTI